MVAFHKESKNSQEGLFAKAHVDLPMKGNVKSYLTFGHAVILNE